MAINTDNLSINVPPYVRDTSVKVTESAPGESRVEDRIQKYLNVTSQRPPEQFDFDFYNGNLRKCLDATSDDISKCEVQSYKLSQFLNLNDLFENGAISGLTVDDRTENQIIRDRIEERKNTPVDPKSFTDSVFSNGSTGIGTLLVPFVYIRWGETVLHNSFPSKNLDDDPGQVRNNVRGFTISYDTQSNGGESTGGSGAGNSGTSTCELTLNPQLVDANGRAIEVFTNGAELTIMWGYPNSGQVRVHTFAQTGIRDSYYNDQTTTVSFRGIEWKLSRTSEQRRYASGDWRNRVTEMALQACKSLDYEEENCKIVFDPEDFATGDNKFDIGETAQTGPGNAFGHLTRVVERTQGCTVSKTVDREGKRDDQRGIFTITISCKNTLDVDDGTDPRIVDRALWLGQVLAERIEISDAGDGTANQSNTGGSCGNKNRRRRAARVPNAILKSFVKGCDYLLDRANDIFNRIDTTLQDEYLLKLSQLNVDDASPGTSEDTDVATSVPILSPFKGKVIARDLKINCGSTEEASDKTCGPDGRIDRQGTGNSVVIVAEEPDNSLLEGIEVTFYHLASVAVDVGSTVQAGDVIGTQGTSGSITDPATGIRFSREDATLTREESQPLINDYIRTITYRCSQVGVGCLLPGYVTTFDVGVGAPDHIHIQTLDRQRLLQAFDNMANADPNTCYNLNNTNNVAQTGATKCWDPNWTNTLKADVAAKCVEAHEDRFGSPCDFYIFDKTDESQRKVLNEQGLDANGQGDTFGQRNRVLANPFPDLNHFYSDSGNAGAGVRFFASSTVVPGFFSNSGQNQGLEAQLFHGDNDALTQSGLGNQTIIQCEDDETINDVTGNEFLANSDIANLTNNPDIKKNQFDWANAPETLIPRDNTNKLYISAGHYWDNNATGTGGANNFSFNYTDTDGDTRIRTLEGIINIRAARFFATYGAQFGFDVELDFGKQTRPATGDSFVQVAERARDEQNNEDRYAIDLHCDTATGNAGVLPPSAKFGDTVHIYDKRLGKEFGAFTKQGTVAEKAMTDRGARILELTPLDGGTITKQFEADIRSGDYTQSDRILESWAFRFFSAIRNEALDETLFSQSGGTSADTSFCGVEGQYPNDATDRNIEVLERFCAINNCNSKDVAAFIQAESSWRLASENDNKCTGIFQCCPGAAPEAKMAEILANSTNDTDNPPQWWPEDGVDFNITKNYFKGCGDIISPTVQPLEVQLQTYLAYKEATGQAQLSEGLCLNYTEIALPALVSVVRSNYNANYREACEVNNSREDCLKFFNQNSSSWFAGKSYETAEVKGICQYAIRSAIDDPRLSGVCTFGAQLSGGSGNDSVGCRNTSVNRTLNARNEGTLTSGGLIDLKFRQEIKLNAEFGVCPRNIFLAPTTSDGFPMYILLANMDNSDGFADFKIRSVQLTWQGTWRWNITAYRPADSVIFEAPQTLRQPRSLNEWINYYWFPNFQEDGNQFAATGQKAEFNADGNILNTIKSSSIASLNNNASLAIQRVFDNIRETYNTTRRAGGKLELDEQVSNELNAQIDIINDNCISTAAACARTIRTKLETFQDIAELVIIISSDDSERNLNQWWSFEILGNLDEVAGDISKTREREF